MATKPKKVTARYTTTSGQKVVKYSDGTKTYSGGGASSSSPKSNTAALEEKLGGLVETAKGLQKSGKTSSGLEANIARSESMLKQTKREGNKAYKGSTEEAAFRKDYPTYVEPTVISDTTIREDAIPELNKKIDTYAETGQYYDNNGNLHNADGSVVDSNGETGTYGTGSAEADSLLKSADEDMQGIFDTLDALTKQTDQNTASQIKSIKAQYDVLRQQQEEINRREQASEDTMLLLGGSSRYTSSAVGLSAGIQRAGIMELAALDAAEMSAISEAKAAQAEQNYKLAAEKIDLVEVLRKEKIDKATEIAKTVAEENKKMRERMEKQTVESAIADLFRQGITEPADILEYINYKEDGTPSGGFVTLKEIQDTLAIIDPAENLKGASSDYQTYKMMQKAGEIPDGWSFFDYKAAVTNAGKKTGSGGADDFTEQEQRKLEMEFGPDWKNTASRQEQLEFLYGKGADTQFTDTQIAQGAANAGVSIEEFKRIDADQQNEYINGPLKEVSNDLNIILAGINSGNVDQEEGYADIRELLQSYGFDPEIYQGGKYAADDSALLSLYSAYEASK